MTKPRVRFAPSPTGYLHIGGARTALFNWLWARKTGGTFILRIEDTDQERSTEASKKIILDGLRWLGLEWDEGPGVGGDHGPYSQMERLSLYQEFADKLVAAGGAYRCYCTREMLDAQRNALPEKERERWSYPGTCRDRKDHPDLPWVLRLKTPRTGAVEYVDKVYGKTSMRCDAIGDQVLMRANGVPLYNFGAAVDDLTMGVTLVARGNDHLLNTPTQILIYKALGAELPEFAHLPLMLTPDGKKISKRNAEVFGIDIAIERYHDKGWMPDAVLNLLSRFGWSHGDQEIFTRDELVSLFDWEHVGAKDGRFDKKKAQWIAAEHLRKHSDEALAEMVLPFLKAHHVEVLADDPRLIPAVRTVKPRASTLSEMADAMAFYFITHPPRDEAAAQKHLTPEARARLAAIADRLEGVEVFSEAHVTAAMEAWLAEHILQIKDVAQAARVALTGKAASPGLYEVMAVLGRDATVSRLRAAASSAP
ncbi:MAG: glutamate--tRNA ligase [Polyangiales bacterium]